ncbi:DUF2345 domain-containing protein, partial [Pseudomonas graminis]|uniref:DUF2345 domain-containing protein n=1 Tax=Pseudomonas graminis TaxID=158627 RepID=UPI002349EC36
DDRGKEHIKLSTEHSGKSQLNLGHLVDNEKDKRGEGFELRTDGWGAIRAGSGLFISADEQTRAHGQQLDMDAAIDQLETALSLARTMAQAAKSAGAIPADTSGHTQLNDALTNLTEPGLLLHAPAGIGIVTPEAICVSSGRESVAITSSRSTDLSAGRNITGTAEGAISLCAVTQGLQLKAVQGDVQLHAQTGALHALANNDIKIQSLAGRIEISAPEELLLHCGGAFIRIKDGEIELGAPGNIYPRAVHVVKGGATTLTTPVTPIPYGYGAGYTLVDAQQAAARFVRYRITTQNGEVFNGVTDKDGKTMPVHTMLPGHVAIDFPQSEERLKPRPTPELEEEEEFVEGITLRIGMFFDGTGNNRDNSEKVRGCFARDVNLAEAAPGIVQFCAKHGFDGNGSAPDNSYGNDSSNVAKLYELYQNDSDRQLADEDNEAALRVYLEGIGTSSTTGDSIYSQATGLGAQGVRARVEESPGLILETLQTFRRNNPNKCVKRIEFDIFGFSRGAAAARDFANELLKGEQGILAQALPSGSLILAEKFAWKPQTDFCINYIGIFDTVAAIAAWMHGDFSGNNAKNPGVDIRLAPNAAKKVVHLVAKDERRYNFSLNKAGTADIALPGVHSDLGGGYLPVMAERVLLSKPGHDEIPWFAAINSSTSYKEAQSDLAKLQKQYSAYDLPLEISTWHEEIDLHVKGDSYHAKRVHAAVISQREVHSDLALVYLRIMRELAVQNGVPFGPIDENNSRLALPFELQPINDKLMAYALGKTSTYGLSAAEESLLYRRYVHLSSHWNPATNMNANADVAFINRPSDNGLRTEHPNE